MIKIAADVKIVSKKLDAMVTVQLGRATVAGKTRNNCLLIM